jgi:hypothetical protein
MWINNTGYNYFQGLLVVFRFCLKFKNFSGICHKSKDLLYLGGKQCDVKKITQIFYLQVLKVYLIVKI